MTLTKAHLLNPSIIGFERVLSMLDNITVEKNTFPHHNVIKTGENTYDVELAVAGYGDDDISVEIEDGELHIRGKIENELEREYIHRGIATRSFHKTISIANTVEVRCATLHNGILTISLENVIPESKKPRKIPILGKSEKQLLVE